MKLKFYCPHWGSKHLPFKQFALKCRQGGFDGVEMSLPTETQPKEEILQILNDHQLELIGQHWETKDADFARHKIDYEKRLYNLASANPLFINSQTGKDYFSQEQNLELIRLAHKVSKDTGVKIIHETHRGKFSFACHVLANYLDLDPQLRLCLDVSHWFNVAESDLSDQMTNVDKAVARTDHIHTRIGHAQAPQITDPRAPVWESMVNIHFTIWDQVYAIQQKSGKEDFTITTEFGPPPYMTLIPLTGQPIANQWEINLHMKKMVTERYKNAQ